MVSNSEIEKRIRKILADYHLRRPYSVGSTFKWTVAKWAMDADKALTDLADDLEREAIINDLKGVKP